MKKILIAYATAGIGHKKAAMAVKKVFDELAPKDTEVTLIDSLDYTNRFFKWSYLATYLLAINKLSAVWGFMYYLTNNPCVDLIVSKIRRLNNWLNSGPFVKYLLETKPDVVISTHFFASEVISDMKKKGIFNTHLMTVITDYRLHSWWVYHNGDSYIVASTDAKEELIARGIEPSRIHILGIPVEPEFSRELDTEAILNKFALKKGLFTVLIIGGGFGVGPIEEMVKVVGGITAQKLQVIVICGHNDNLVKRIEALKECAANDIKALGFVNNVYDFMAVSDILISKSGGITVTESLAKKLPIIIIAPIPGQETYNASYLIKEEAAVKIADAAELKSVLEEILAHPGKLTRMKESIMRIRRPNAASDVVKLALKV